MSFTPETLAAAAVVVATGAAVETDAAVAPLRAELAGAAVDMATVVLVATVEAAVVPVLVSSAVVVVAIVVAVSAGLDAVLGPPDAAADASAAAFVAVNPTALVVGAAWPQAASASTATVAAPARNHARREYCT